MRSIRYTFKLTEAKTKCSSSSSMCLILHFALAIDLCLFVYFRVDCIPQKLPDIHCCQLGNCRFPGEIIMVLGIFR